MLEIVEGVKVDVGGVADSQVTDLEICQAAGIVDMIGDGPIIVIMSQYADYEEGDTIHSAVQLRKFGAIVDDTARSCGGRQCIITAEGYVIPLHIRDGLARMDMRPPNDVEMEHYPHVFLTADSPWDPSCIDDEYEDTYHDTIMGDPEVEKRREERDPIIIQGTSLSSELPQGDRGAIKEAEVRTASARTSTASQPACIGQDGSHILTVTSIQYEINSTGWLPSKPASPQQKASPLADLRSIGERKQSSFTISLISRISSK